jgi:hypothetical protein
MTQPVERPLSPRFGVQPNQTLSTSPKITAQGLTTFPYSVQRSTLRVPLKGTELVPRLKVGL